MAGAYWPAPWSCEDGGPRRQGWSKGVRGLALAPGERLELAASIDAYGTDMLIRREPGELFALRHGMPLDGPGRSPVDAWVERLDPDTLALRASSPRLPGGPYWPGGIAAHADGALLVVFGCWAHRLSPELELLASHRLPAPRPYNSFVLLDGGELVTKDCDAPRGLEPSTVSVLDPRTLLALAPPLELPEPCIARLSCDGESVIAVGATRLFRLRLERGPERLVIDEQWAPEYGPAPGRSYGWDPVITDEHVLWMDNGRNATDRTMLASGSSPDPVRLWCSRLDDGATQSLEISGLPYGTESNPPAWDPVGRIVIAYDAGNAVLAAWRMHGEGLEPLWRRERLAHAGHLIVYPDTRELVAQDFHDARPALRHPWVRRPLRRVLPLLAHSAAARRASLRAGTDSVVVLDLDTGEEKARARVPSPSQAFLFPAPGFARDVYYQSITTIARLIVVPE